MKQREFTEEDLMKFVDRVKSFCSVEKACEYASGKVIFYIDDYLERESGYHNTSVDDLISIFGDNFNFNAMGVFDGSGIVELNSIRIANKNDFRGILKYTPQNTLRLCIGTLGKDGYEGNVFHVDKYPIKQSSEISKDGILADADFFDYYKYLCNNKALCSDKRYILGKEYEKSIIPVAHLLVSNYFEVVNSWCIAYEYGGATFLVPIDIEDLKSALKNRDRVDGRKRVLPTIVKEYFRQNGEKVGSHIRMFENGFDLKGEHFYFVLGIDAIKLRYHKNANGLNKLKNDIEMGKGWTYSSGDEIIVSPNGTGIYIRNGEAKSVLNNAYKESEG